MNDFLKKVSVVMSVYSYRNYIRESIKSILTQTLQEFEFIIIDDGCDYDLSKIIREFGDSRIIYIKNPENIGLTSSLIKGVKESKGKYIARHDAGNISLKNRLETQYNFMEKNSRYYLIGSSVELIDEDGNTICKIIADDDSDYIKKKLPTYNCINHSTIMFRNTGRAHYREKFKYAQDYDMYLNLLSENLVPANIADVLLKERIIPSSITYLRKAEQEFFKELAKKFYFEKIKRGRDSYNLISAADLPAAADTGKAGSKKDRENYFYRKQKIYYILFSGRTVRARKLIINSLKEKFDFKLFMYLVASFFPFIIKLRNKLRNLEYR